MITHDVKQGSIEWLQLRLGIPTASEFGALVSPKWKSRTGEMPKSYLHRKLCEKVLGQALDTGDSLPMEHGKILEEEAIPWFKLMNEIDIQRVGFCTTDDGRIGCSPDGLIGDDNGIEIKCPQPHTHLKYLIDGGVPNEYKAQVHGSMFVTGRSQWTFLSYSRKLPPLVVKVRRDEKIQKVIRDSLKLFLANFDASLTKVEELGV